MLKHGSQNNRSDLLDEENQQKTNSDYPFLGIADSYKNLSSKIHRKYNNRLFSELENIEKNQNYEIELTFHGNSALNFYSRVTDEDIKIICSILSKFSPYLINIDLSWNLITGKGVGFLADLLKSCVNLRAINIQHNTIGAEGGNYLFEALIFLKENYEKFNLEYINIEGCLVGPAGLLKTTVEEKTDEEKKTLIEIFLTHNEVIKDLIIGQNDLNDVCLIEIFAMLNPTLNNCSLQSLCLDSVSPKAFSIEIAFEISKVLKINKKLENLSLKQCRITDEVLNVMLKEINMNEVLKVLDLNANLISYKGCYILSEFLKSSYCGLLSLNLSRNQIGNIGTQLIFQALKTNDSLIHLDLNHNGIKKEGLLSIALIIKDCSNFASLNVFWNEFDKTTIEEFWKIVFDYKKDFHFDFGTDFENGEYSIYYNPEVLPVEFTAKKQFYCNSMLN